MKQFLAILGLSTLAIIQSSMPLIGVGRTVASGGSITVVQHKSTHCAAATCALAFTSNVTVGNTLIYLCAGQNTTAMSAATDNNSNTIANANSKTASGAIRVDYVASANGGATTVTCGETSALRVHTHIWEISGLVTKVFDAGNTGSQTATAQTISTSAGTTAANEIVFGFFYDQPNGDNWTAGSGYSPSEIVVDASNESSISEVKIVSSTGTQTATATCAASQLILQSIATFK